jgi:hypothetical protein
MHLPPAAVVALLVSLAMAPRPASAASPLDGFWMVVKDDKSLDPGSQVEYKVDRDWITMTTPMGSSYRARSDGADAAMENDANTTSVSVKLQGRHTLVQTDKNQGKPWRVVTIEVQPDGKTAKITWKNLTNNSTGSYTMNRQ